MKRVTLALSLLALSTAASANTGSLQFKGKITNATCPIEVIDPVTGGPAPAVQLGDYEASYFTAANQRTKPAAFQLKMTTGANCGLTPGDDVVVTYSNVVGNDPDYYLNKTGAGFAQNVAIAIQDHTLKDVKPNTASSTYQVSSTGETLMAFQAALVSTTATVMPGAVEADVQFVVDTP